MTQETKNIILATCLSILVVLGWETFYAGPQLEKQRQLQAQMHPRPAPGSQQAAPQTGNPSAQVEEPAPQKTRDEALAESPRIKLDAPAVYGSIALKGARIDDVSFKHYRETVDPNSPHIILLSPADSPEPYFIEGGFIADPSSNLLLPGRDTLWQADRDTLTESSPVTLTYDNG
ncbi:MAG TPA: membrane protein insertase YidC, partial [Methylocella sp.]|nr:membrane protein insertase YidC [Methylocella sp.]